MPALEYLSGVERSSRSSKISELSFIYDMEVVLPVEFADNGRFIADSHLWQE